MKYSLFILGIIMQAAVYACGGYGTPNYGGQITYQLDSLNPLNCTVLVAMDFDINEGIANDSIYIYWGDDITTAVYATGITEDTAATNYLGNVHIYTHSYKGTHLYASYPSGGYYTISIWNQYRLNFVNNITNGSSSNVPFYFQCLVGIDSAAQLSLQGPSLPPLTIGLCELSSFTFGGFNYNNSSGDSIAISLVTPMEASGVNVPQYQLPDQYCQANGTGADTFNLNPSTGQVYWSSPCLQGTYTFAIVVSQYKNGQLTGTAMRDQNIFVDANLPNGIKEVSSGNILSVYPNPAANQITVRLPLNAGGKLVVSNILGKEVYATLIENSPVVDINLQGLANGFYVITYQSNSQNFTAKICKQ